MVGFWEGDGGGYGYMIVDCGLFVSWGCGELGGMCYLLVEMIWMNGYFFGSKGYWCCFLCC